MGKQNEKYPIICKPTFYNRLVIVIYNAVFLLILIAALIESSLSTIGIVGLVLAWSNLEFFLTFSPQLYIYRENIHIVFFHKTIVMEWKDITQVKAYSSVRQRTLISFEKSFFPGNITGILHNRFQPTVILERYSHTNYMAAVKMLSAKLGDRFYQSGNLWI